MRYVIVTGVDISVVAEKIDSLSLSGYELVGALSHTKINHGWTQTDNPSVEYVEPMFPEEDSQVSWYQYHYAQMMVKP